jgi:hypothetical protein
MCVCFCSLLSFACASVCSCALRVARCALRVVRCACVLLCAVHALEQGGLALQMVLDSMGQVVAGLLHLHSYGILHRDLRASNVLLLSLEPLRVVLADFGVSHQLSEFSGGRHDSSPSGASLGRGTILRDTHVRLARGLAGYFLDACSSKPGVWLVITFALWRALLLWQRPVWVGDGSCRLERTRGVQRGFEWDGGHLSVRRVSG